MQKENDETKITENDAKKTKRLKCKFNKIFYIKKESNVVI